MKNIVVLGAGLVGSAIIKDMATDYSVLAIDNDNDKLMQFENLSNIDCLKTDITDYANFKSAVKDVDLIIGALPGFLGYQSVQYAIQAGKNMVDISFFPEDPFEIDQMAKEKSVTIITDCGIAPGMGNIILGHYISKMEVENFRCLVGGLPVKRELPWQYKAVFSPIDVIEEYTRPARYVENGQVITRSALSDPENIHFDDIGTLTAFNSDGLRSLLSTCKVPNMIEKTLRYPGTIEYLQQLRESGFFSEKKVLVNNIPVKAIDFTAALVFPQWKLQKNEKEFTLMQIELSGWLNKEWKSIRYNLLDYTDLQKGISSMARTTGYTASAVANIVLAGSFIQTGINPPEYVGMKEGLLQYCLNYLSERGVNFKISE